LPHAPTTPLKKIYQIKAYIDTEYANIHNISDLTQRFFYSREYITREFRKHFNTPIYQYIVSRKLLLSKKYIHLGITIDKAARMAGFTNMASYIKLFKKDTGLTPSEYQKRSLNQ
jgi:AraC-like DNA-binding protein